MAVLALFVFGITLLGAATEALSPALERLLAPVVVGDPSALGVAWLASYVLGNGSVVATLALSLFVNDLLGPSQLFLMVAGSRLGSAAIVLFVGALDYVQKGPLSLRDSLGLGLLAFVLTYTVYLPATLVGYVSLPWARSAFARLDTVGAGVRAPSVLDPLTTALTEQFGGLVAFVVALALVVVSLRLFDRVFDRVDDEWLRAVVFSRFENPWLSFATGVVVTAATTSVAFSLGVVVPLYNRDYIERSEVVPYVLGANVGTFADTLLVAFVLQSPTAVATVVLLVGLGTVFTLVALLRYETYYEAVAAVHDRVLANRITMTVAITCLVLVPLGLLFVR